MTVLVCRIGTKRSKHGWISIRLPADIDGKKKDMVESNTNIPNVFGNSDNFGGISCDVHCRTNITRFDWTVSF